MEAGQETEMLTELVWASGENDDAARMLNGKERWNRWMPERSVDDEASIYAEREEPAGSFGTVDSSVVKNVLAVVYGGTFALAQQQPTSTSRTQPPPDDDDEHTEPFNKLGLGLTADIALKPMLFAPSPSSLSSVGQSFQSVRSRQAQGTGT
ncbi:hypothetical protein Dda_4144 [Drechslerella dactyloides]|uniref:Uncharacterized protein n=1 Tax=Drechslerella dactyloides TaxID=74499 RepID=A0AAD6NK67_DREDA|nr:hypothetical protein Dda_4144 [Drechslerella dactyloides]